MTLVDNKVGILDMDKVVLITHNRESKIDSHFSRELAYQEARRKRKVRRLDFEVR